MTEYLAVLSREGIIASYKPFIYVKAMLIGDGRVLALGSIGSVKHVAGFLGAKIYEYKHPILPGFVDAHMHIDGLGMVLMTSDLSNARSIDEILDVIGGSRRSISGWIIGRGFDHERLVEKKPPARDIIDKVVSDKPVLIIHRSGHMGVVNSPGLRIVLQIMGDDLISRYVDLERGFLFEDALYILLSHIRDGMDYTLMIEQYLSAYRHLVENGVTAIGVTGISMKSFNTLMDLVERGLLKLRTYAYFHMDRYVDYKPIVGRALNLYRRNNRLRINGLKLFIDGALGTWTAYLSKPYSDKPSTVGKLLLSYEELSGIINEASEYGLQVAVHAIGDAALDNVLKAYNGVRECVAELRHRIEHASLVRDDQLEVIRRIKPVVVVQPHFVITDKWLLDRIGVERVRWSYRFRSLYNATTIAFSTDAPVEPVNPWETVYAAVTRGVEEGLKHGELTIDERMELINALHAYTRGGAYALYDDRLGCLTPGCYADYIVVDRNPFKIPMREIRGIRVLETIIGGEKVYSRHG